MVELRFHGRGGQGAVIASKVLACAVFKTGKFVQSFPKFGVERRGAPIEAYLRIDDDRILLRNNVYTPDHLIVMDASLIEAIDVTAGLKPGGTILINSSQCPEDFSFLGPYRIACVDASDVAVRHRLGGRSSPIVNTAILGAIAASMNLIDLERVVEAILEEVPIKPNENAQAAREAFEQTMIASTTNEGVSLV